MVTVGVVRLKYFPFSENICLRQALNSGTMGWIHLSDLATVGSPKMRSVGTDRIQEKLLSNPS